MVKKNQPRLVCVAGPVTKQEKRITKGEGFVTVGGSKDQHEELVEKVVKISEKLAKKGLTIDSADHDRLGEAIEEQGYKSVASMIQNEHNN